MAVSIVTPPSPVEHDGPPDYWSGLARCPSVAAVTPLKPRPYNGGTTRRNWCCNRRVLLALGLLCCILVIVVLYTKRSEIYGKNEQSNKTASEKPKGWTEWLEMMGNKQKEPEYDKYIFTEPMEGPLGNQMYRFASLYAMGQQLNRTPVFMHGDTGVKKMNAELDESFPNLHERLYFLKSDFDDYEQFAMAIDCCDYHDPKKLLAHNDARGLMLTGGPNFQNYRYFQAIRPQIVQLYEFNPEMVKKVAGIKKRMMKADKMHKICVHTRSGDLAAFGELKTYEVTSAIERVVQMLPKFKKKPTAKYSIVLFGEAKDYEQSIKIGNKTLNNVYHLADVQMNEGEELCFALLACDSLLLTDSLSPYAFWMGYLMPEDRPIFYVRKQMELPNSKVDSLELLPSDWLAIEQDWLKKE